jgi:ABC-2 type transport system ATP-binding protein
LKQQGRTILFSTHIIEHAERICDHVCIIARGRKVADGSIPEVKRTRGGEHVAVRVERWTSELGRLLRAHPAVAGLREQGDGAELALRDGGDPHGLLDALLAAGARVRRFEILEPSLEQVFIDASSMRSWTDSCGSRRTCSLMRPSRTTARTRRTRA